MRHKDVANVELRVLMLTTAEVSRLLYVHPNTLRRWSNRGIIRTYHVGPRADRRFRQDDIACFLAQLKLQKGNPYKVEIQKQIAILASKLAVVNINERYVRSALGARSPIKGSEFPQELVKTYQELMKLRRFLKENVS